MRFKVRIKKETIEEMPYLKKYGVTEDKVYNVVDKIDGKLLIHVGEGEMVEIYPRKCLLAE